MVLAGLFLGSLTMLNILGISRFIKLFEAGGFVFALATLILTGHVFKVLNALIDTIPFYIGTRYLRRYLQMPDMNRIPQPKEALIR